MKSLQNAPAWLLRPLPINAAVDDKLNERIDGLCAKLPASIAELDDVLLEVRVYTEYDAVVNRACACIWEILDRFYASAEPDLRLGLLSFARNHMVEQAQARIVRRLVKDPVAKVRAKARQRLKRSEIKEVALPLEPEGDWSPTGWLKGTQPAALSRHKQGRRVQAGHGLPELSTIKELRELLGIRSERQLGYFLLASDHDDGPYTRFTIPKRDGGERVICAPKGQLRWVQRQVLDRILAKVSVHDAAHGFVPGRSTVTNAAHHRGAAMLLKFDLTDFFPTIHYYRVLGLFARLGYVVGDARFQSHDLATQLAPTLARLCCYTADPHQWGNAVLPQGAPTSPAISNLVCRRLDARLNGLAKRNGGTYTRYADDLTFSFKQKDVNLGRFRWWVDQVCHQEGFFVNQGKFRVIRASQRQLVTGVVVNDQLRVPRDARRRFRAILHNCRTHGIASQARGHPRFTAYLRGFASYVNMVHPEEGADLLREVDALLGPEPPADEAEGGAS